MKRKRFYNNKKRNQKWTEEVQGRKIDFADKYVYSGPYSDKFDSLRPKEKKRKRVVKEKLRLIFKRAITVLCALAVVSCGYTVMDVYMQRNSMPENSGKIQEEDVLPGIANVNLNFSASYVETASLDNSSMLDAVISSATKNKSNAVFFDLKREDGTLAYNSSLAAVSSYNAVSLPASDLKGSVQKLLSNDFMCIGGICCYKDNVAPYSSSDSALKAQNGSYLTDASGSAYLNPENEYVYEYIKGIVTDGAEAGISVFMLSGCTVPTGNGSEKDCCEALVEKLSNDFQNSVKFVFPVFVSVTEQSVSSYSGIREAVDKIIEEKPIGENEIYVFSTDFEEERLREVLLEKNIKRYIIKKQVTQ